MDIMIDGVAKTFDDVTALESIRIKIKSGSFTTLLGPSGCGKTTLLRMVAGLETPDKGEIWFADECIFSASRKLNKPTHRRNIGMVFQDFALWPHMTVFENIAYSLRASGQTNQLKDKVLHALDVVRLTGKEQRFPHQLSGGQQQRVAFARAIVSQPQLILFDEPLSALDATLREEMRLELMQLVKMMGLTALYVTHDQVEALAMSDEMVVMNQGQILQIGQPEDVYRKPTHEFVAGFIGKANWIVPNQQMIRPEHVKWQGQRSDIQWSVQVKNVSYIGDRYELQLDMGKLGEWTAYANHRRSVGEQVQVYVSPLDIHHMNKQSNFEILEAVQ